MSSTNSCAISYGNSGSSTDHSLGFNEQLTMAVFKLQHSLDRVVNRIDALESVLTLQSVRETQIASIRAIELLIDSLTDYLFSQKCLEKDRSTRAGAISKWLFPELSGRTTAFVIAWPLVLFLALHYVKQIRKK